ncbi:MAG: hypothetical protein Q7P63_12390 [Verrucomicrobiota bacterium JB022]|nr:hypothetical protein [Verrucomicrobiota bacterium JB022]
MPDHQPNPAPSPQQPDRKTSRGFWKVWIFVLFAFVALSAAWYTLIKIASENRPEEVPLPPKEAPATEPQP